MLFTFYKQMDSMDCGPTCLRMVAKYYGKNIPVQQLRENAQLGKQGANMLGISEAAEIIGFRTQAAKIVLNTLKSSIKLPAILYWNQNHFVVLYKTGRNKFHIADPAKGLMRLNTVEFKESWVIDQKNELEEGVVLALEPDISFYENNRDDHEEKKSTMEFKSILKYVLPYKKLGLQLFIGIILASTLQLFLPFLTQSIVDIGVNSADIHFVTIILLAQIALLTGRLVIDLLRNWILLYVSTRINISILTDFLIKLMKLPAYYFDSKRTGDILQRMNDHSRIRSFLTGSSLNILFSLLNLLIFSVILVVFNFTIFIVFLLGTCLYSFWVLVFLKRRRNLDYQRFDLSAKEQGIAIQLVQGMQEIKLNGAERPMRWGWERLQSKLFYLSSRELSLSQSQQFGGFFLNEGRNIIITFLSAKAVIEGHLTLGSMLAIQYIIGQLNSPIEQMVGFIQNMQDARISMDRLNEVHSMKDEEPIDKHLLHELPIIRNEKRPEDVIPIIQIAPYAIHFRNVSFTYSGAGNEPVLKGINLNIPIGKTTAIVGMSGSGKTTILKLLLKFYTPQGGEISVGSTALENISHKTWRNHCGVVMQDSFIFSDTIAKNIAVGVDEPDTERLRKAAEIANIQDFICELPLGYNTMIGAEGTGISVGQKQRILIARAVYRNPEFIFFDEATNSLDANNESIIMRNLDTFFEGRTVVVVAHRLSTVIHADQVILLNKGKIIERGTHHDLVNLKGEYYTLVKNQLEVGT